MSQKDDEPSAVTLDMIYLKIGQFGKYQKIIYLLVCVPMFCNAVFQFGYVFTTSAPIYRYIVWLIIPFIDLVYVVLLFRCTTACDARGSFKYSAPYVNFTIPQDSNGAGHFSKCLRFKEKESAENFTCSPDHFDTKVEECTKEEFIFRDKVTSIANEVNI